MSRSLLVLAMAFGLAAPAFAQAPEQATPAAKPAKKGLDDPNRIVCKREHVVGSNRPQKVCMTVAERQRLKDQADRITDPSRSTNDTIENNKAGQPMGG